MLRPVRLNPPFTPGVSVLKPVRPGDALPEESVKSNQEQDYPEFEVLYGTVGAATPNRKVGKLIELGRQAKYPVLIIADSDIKVPPDYLRRVVAPLENPAIGLVTCVYRARADHMAGRFEALGVVTDFMPSTFVAPFVGVDEFALGATMAVRRTDLERMGGFAAIADYIADDYQLGRRIHDLGLKCVLADVVVETHLTADRMSAVWKHQVRWARTLRFSRAAYAGLPVTHATTWALLALLSGEPWVAAGLMVVRYAMAIMAGWVVLRSGDVLKLWWLIPARDLFATAVWCAGMFGHTVDWAGERLRLDAQGRILR